VTWCTPIRKQGTRETRARVPPGGCPPVGELALVRTRAIVHARKRPRPSSAVDKRYRDGEVCQQVPPPSLPPAGVLSHESRAI